MKISFSWLKELISLENTADEIATILTNAGLEVENFTLTTPSFSGVVVADVTNVVPHPNADLLRIATVFDGKESFQVVCKAANCRSGIRTAFAKVGATLKDEKGSFTIKLSKLRDVESYGMLCALAELGLEKESEGIVELDSTYPLGTDFASLFVDTIFEISLTPNLGHCLSVLGVARELSAFTGKPLKHPPLLEKMAPQETLFSIEVTAKTLCDRYAAMAIESIPLKDTPLWMKRRLELSGYQASHFLVDIGNYVMHELGQPLHFFDKKSLVGNHLTIKTCGAETLHLLNDKSVNLKEGSLVIADKDGIVALAGIMGASRGSIQKNTESILIEAAHFEPSSIRKSAKTLGIKSESSYRFERGTDPLGPESALKRAAYLIQTLGGEAIFYKPVFYEEKPYTAKKLLLRLERITKLLGVHVPKDEVVAILKSLDMKVSVYKEEIFHVEIPSYRGDLNIEEDLIEEVGRMYGLENLQKTPSFTNSPMADTPLYTLEKRLHTALRAQCLQEFLNCDLISPELIQITDEITLPASAAITVLHPSSVEQSVLRTSLLPGLLMSIKHNANHQSPDIHAYEIGKVHFQEQGHFYEHLSAGIVLTGLKSPYYHNPKATDVDFFDLKGVIENLFTALHIKNIRFESSHLKTLHPKRQAKIFHGDILLGILGEVHPEKLQKFDLKASVYFAEITLAPLLKLVPSELKMHPLTIYPGSSRDWSLTLKKETLLQEILNATEKASSKMLHDVSLLDIYESENLGPLLKSVTLRLRYLDPTKTLSYEEVEKEHERIKKQVCETLHI